MLKPDKLLHYCIGTIAALLGVIGANLLHLNPILIGIFVSSATGILIEVYQYVTKSGHPDKFDFFFTALGGFVCVLPLSFNSTIAQN